MTAKPRDEYYVHTADTGNLRRECKQCTIDGVLERKYNITIAEFKKMEKAQNGRCLICKRKPKSRLSVDHCHTTGDIRGLLCSNCNTAIGLLHEDTERMKNAIRYLQGEDIV